MVEAICKAYEDNPRKEKGKVVKQIRCNQIAVSGGSFINRILLEEVATGLKNKGKVVYTNEKVPCGDGGIALGQAFLMANRLKEQSYEVGKE